MPGRLDGKVALITGAAQGQGSAEARLFAAEGAQVALTDVLDEVGEKEAAEIGHRAIYRHLDVRQEADWERVVATVEDTFGTVTTLVNNAGIFDVRPLVETAKADYERVVAVNQVGCFLGMKVVGRQMIVGGAHGSIVNISSVAGLVGNAGTVAYTASKYAIRGMTKSAAIEFGPHWIRVNSIHPGFVNTAMTKYDPEDPVGVQRREDRMSSLPLHRAAEPMDVARLALFLASDESSYCTGTEYVIDGGMLAGLPLGR